MMKEFRFIYFPSQREVLAGCLANGVESLLSFSLIEACQQKKDAKINSFEVISVNCPMFIKLGNFANVFFTRHPITSSDYSRSREFIISAFRKESVHHSTFRRIKSLSHTINGSVGRKTLIREGVKKQLLFADLSAATSETKMWGCFSPIFLVFRRCWKNTIFPAPFRTCQKRSEKFFLRLP